MSSGVRRFNYVFGPVRSRRLGRSLGVNNIPYKTCTYSCIYCQLGKTTNCIIERRTFYDAEKVVDEICLFLIETQIEVDYVTFVPDGEPLLDKNLGLIIHGVKSHVQKPIAVLTNASLLFLEDARIDLLEADLVSIKVDALNESTWRIINRPNANLTLQQIKNGIYEFSKEFKGVLLTETMLVNNFNTSTNELNSIADFIKTLNPWRAYISIPIRPPAEPFVKPPPPEVLLSAYSLFSDKLGDGKVELLNLPEPPDYNVYGDPEIWLLNIASVHPIKVEYALKALEKSIKNPDDFIRRLIRDGKINIIKYEGEEFILKTYKRK